MKERANSALSAQDPATVQYADLERNLDLAAEAVSGAEGLVITAGAGIGIDSGLPEFRGTAGFWRTYPPFAHLGLRFEEMANSALFLRDPLLAWGFYGHRLSLYREVEPHRGYEVLHRWAGNMPGGGFIFTSNVDGHFQRAGFAPNRVVECHGSLHHLQCARPCRREIWAMGGIEVAVDETTLRATSPLPACPWCGGLARPNVLMFGDWLWVAERTSEQEARFRNWLDEMGEKLIIVEIGAGTAVPTVRLTSEHLARRRGARLVRINPRDSEVPLGAVSIPASALWAIEEIDARLRGEAPPSA